MFIDMFDMCKHPKYGTYVHLPASGGILQQPAKTMSVFEVLRGLWLQKIARDIESATKR